MPLWDSPLNQGSTFSGFRRRDPTAELQRYGQQNKQEYWRNFGATYNTMMTQQAPNFASLDQQLAAAETRNAMEGQMRRAGYDDQAGAARNALRQLPWDQRSLDIERGLLGQKAGFTGREYGLDIDTAKLAEDRARDQFGIGERAMKRDAAERGLDLSSQGVREGRHDLATQLWRSMTEGGIARRGAGLKRDRSMADIQAAQKQLDVDAAKLGITGDELRRRLDSALKQAGMSGQLDAFALAEMRASNQVDKVKAGTDTLFALLELPPSTFMNRR